MENPNTFITRFYGMHRVKPHKSDEKHFIIMGSVFNTPLYVHVVYDLKGSSQGRSATEKEKEQVCPVLKDNDWTESKMRLKLGKVGAKLFIDQVQCVSRTDVNQ
jgi:1-phosphatidylinositol-4-phosphate 5-kinase